MSGNKADLATWLRRAGYGENAPGTFRKQPPDSEDLENVVSASDSVLQHSARSKSSVLSQARAAARRASLEVKAKFLERERE